jgi:Ca2+-binding EF-hand superfamily protein
MADDKKEKKKKVKKKEEAAPAAEAPAPEPPPPAEEPKKASTRGSRKQAKRTGSNVFSMFSQKQVAEFKEGFQLMDADKDGILGKNDLRAAHDIVGRMCSEKELDEMLSDAPGPINFTTLLTMFGERMSGGSDDDDVVVAAFKSFDEGDGTIDSEKLRHALMTWGDKFSGKEVDDCYEQFPIDDSGKVEVNAIVSMLTASPSEGGEGEEGAEEAS